MVGRIAFVALLVALAGGLAGCGPCGFSFGIGQPAQSCRGEPPR